MVHIFIYRRPHYFNSVLAEFEGFGQHSAHVVDAKTTLFSKWVSDYCTYVSSNKYICAEQTTVLYSYTVLQIV